MRNEIAEALYVVPPLISDATKAIIKLPCRRTLLCVHHTFSLLLRFSLGRLHSRSTAIWIVRNGATVRRPANWIASQKVAGAFEHAGIRWKRRASQFTCTVILLRAKRIANEKCDLASHLALSRCELSSPHRLCFAMVDCKKPYAHR